MLNENEVRKSFRTERRLGDAQIARIVRQLTQKCRLETEKAELQGQPASKSRRSRRPRNRTPEQKAAR